MSTPKAEGDAVSPSQSRIAILLCAYNAEKYLREQMDSFFRQTHDNWTMWVSNDSSTDRTVDILREYEGRGKEIRIVNGTGRGATANFLALARRDGIDADYFAWSDADDIWHDDKLARAAGMLDRVADGRAALYCGRTEVVDAENRFLHMSPLFTRRPAFRNALCQNMGGGNTMMFNRKARELLRFGEQPDPVTHDWWAYMLISGCGGTVVYDAEPCLRYRQHGGNLIGANMSLRARLFRAGRLFQGVMQEWNERNTAALEARRELLTPEAREVLDAFTRAARAKGRWERLSLFRRSGVFRQYFSHNVALALATVLGRYP